MQPLISIIVPVYKVEPYLRRCVDSILNQTYRNLEVILVDDGSPDNCGNICDAYAKQDSRVKVIHKENGGLSSARNAGMAASSGKYLSFVDSDDVLASDALEHMQHLAESENADIVIGNHIRFEDVLPTLNEGEVKITIRNKEEAMQEFFHNGCAAWARLYRREIHHDILFPEGEINEDEAIVLHLLDRCNRIVYSSRVVYFYMKRSDGESITMAPFTVKDLAWKKNCASNLEFIRQKYPRLETCAAKRYRGSLMWHITKISLLNDCTTYQSEINDIMLELKAEHQTFTKILFDGIKAKIQYFIAVKFGFKVYRTIFRIKRRMHI